jgi:hypothetical protein
MVTLLPTVKSAAGVPSFFLLKPHTSSLPPLERRDGLDYDQGNARPGAIVR